MGLLWMLVLLLSFALLLTDVWIDRVPWAPRWLSPQRRHGYFGLTGEGQRVQDLLTGYLDSAAYQRDMAQLARQDQPVPPANGPPDL